MNEDSAPEGGHQDDTAISPKNRFFLRQNPFFGLKLCRPDESVPEKSTGHLQSEVYSRIREEYDLVSPEELTGERCTTGDPSERNEER